MQPMDKPLSMATILAAPNIADDMDAQDRQVMGLAVRQWYGEDLSTRQDWEKQHADALKAAMQLAEDKTFPWPGASNVRLPLITLAAMQFSARAYPQLVNDPDLVRCSVYRPIADRQLYMKQRATAERIGQHMSFQMLQEDDEWAEDFDRLLLVLALVGSAFKKTWWDPAEGRNRSILVLPNDFVVNYYTKRLNKAPRATHRFWLSANDIESRVRAGLYIKYDQPLASADNNGSEVYAPPAMTGSDSLTSVKDDAQGLHPALNDTGMIEMLEMHCWYDIDGDGYQEPYIITVEKESGALRRVVRRFEAEDIEYATSREVVKIKTTEYFTKYTFLPSPDGGFYEMGLGRLLGHINEVGSTIINQLIDAGTMNNTAGGLMARGIKIKGGAYTFRPFEFQRVDCNAADLKDSIMQWPTKEPSQILFQLLQFLLEYGERVVGATEAMTGIAPGQNTPAETSRNTMEQGLKVYASVILRVYRSLTREFRLWFRLNKKFYRADTSGDFVAPDDYQNLDETSILPSGDPNVVSDGLRLAQANAVLQAAMSAMPGLYNVYEAHKRYLRAWKVQDIEGVLPDPAGPNAMPIVPNPKIEIEKLKTQAQDKAHSQKFIIGMLKEKREAMLAQSKAKKLEADAKLAEAQAASEPVHTALAMAGADQARIQAAHDMNLDQIDLMIREAEQEYERTNQQGAASGMAGTPGNPGASPGAAGAVGGSQGQMG